MNCIGVVVTKIHSLYIYVLAYIYSDAGRENVERLKQDNNSNLHVFKSTCWCKVEKKCLARNWSPQLITRSEPHCQLELGWTSYKTYQHQNDQINVSYVQVIKTYLYVVNRYDKVSSLQLRDCEGISTWTGSTCTRCINCCCYTHKSNFYTKLRLSLVFTAKISRTMYVLTVHSKKFSFFRTLNYKRTAIKV